MKSLAKYAWIALNLLSDDPYHAYLSFNDAELIVDGIEVDKRLHGCDHSDEHK